MIEISFKIQGGAIEEFVVAGHGGGMEGTDILCSAVSAVAQTAVLGLLHHAKDSVLWRREKGYLSVRLKDHDPFIDAILTTMRLGLEDIARQHPARVRILLDE